MCVTTQQLNLNTGRWKGFPDHSLVVTTSWTVNLFLYCPSATSGTFSMQKAPATYTTINHSGSGRCNSKCQDECYDTTDYLICTRKLLSFWLCFRCDYTVTVTSDDVVLIVCSLLISRGAFMLTLAVLLNDENSIVVAAIGMCVILWPQSFPPLARRKDPSSSSPVMVRRSSD